MAHYFWQLLPHVFFSCLFVILDCQGGLSCVPLVFSHDFFPFFNIENYYQCVLYFVFIGDKAIHFVVEMLPVHALVCSGLWCVQD